MRAKKRIEKYGLNELPKKKQDSIFKIIFKEITDPIILLLIVAIIASLLVGEVVDAVAIFLIILVDLIIGTVEEKKANNTAEALSNLVREKVKVIREGKEIQIDSAEITVGDYILLESGDKIEIDFNTGIIKNITKNEEYRAEPFPEFMQNIISNGGLIKSIEKKNS